MRGLFVLSFVLSVVLAMAVAPALAHSASIDAQIEGNVVNVRCLYDGDAPMRYVRVEVLDIAGRLLTKGKTDADGRFTFQVEGSPFGVKVVAQDLLGHRTEYTLTPDDVTK